MKINHIHTKPFIEFKEVEMDECTVQDEDTAYKIAGVAEGYDFQCALLAQMCTFDGEKKTMEELKNLKASDFLELMDACVTRRTNNSAGTSSNSQGTPTSPTRKSKK